MLLNTDVFNEVKSVLITMMISPFCEAQTELSGKEFGFEVESARPLIDVDFKRDNSGIDLKF